MRLHAMECKDEKKIQAFLTHAHVGYLGLALENVPYVVPLNFVWWNGAFYFHGADSGRKVEMMAANPNVCFTVSQAYGTIVNPIPAKTDTAYMSVVAYGTVQRVENLDDATDVLQRMLDKYVPGYYSTPLHQGHVEKYRSRLGSPATVFRIDVRELCAKENAAGENKLYYPGREITMDVSRRRGNIG